MFPFRILALFSITSAVMSPPVAGQNQWSWPERPANLKVLPQDWSGPRLRPVMTGFTRALGVRCSYCHTGEEGKPLSTYDFASDTNPNKERAREMLRMVGSINAHLKNIEPSGDKPVNMWCHTCHRGRPRPMTLTEELGERHRSDGTGAALNLYETLKTNYMGRGAYDFHENSLNAFGYELLAQHDTAGALLVFERNAREFPESGNVWDSLAEVHFKSGNMSEARKYYEKALALDPSNDNARAMLEKINATKR